MTFEYEILVWKYFDDGDLFEEPFHIKTFPTYDDANKHYEKIFLLKDKHSDYGKSINRRVTSSGNSEKYVIIDSHFYTLQDVRKIKIKKALL